MAKALMALGVFVAWIFFFSFLWGILIFLAVNIGLGYDFSVAKEILIGAMIHATFCLISLYFKE